MKLMSIRVRQFGIFLLIVIVGVMAITVKSDDLPPKIPPVPSNQLVTHDQPPEKAPLPSNTDENPPAPKPQEPKVPPLTPPTTPQPISPPAPQQLPMPPSEQDISKNELWHAYEEFQQVNKLIRSHREDPEVDELLNLAKRFYEKAEKLYKDGKYTESKIYAHLTIEALHGVRDILTKEG
ncbi:hypothetical protein [Thermococcus barophilus]|uniref:Uncharacterized protein n=1 Tax=Thermococcus barophilus TaxID=55802 RepID=A0A0S1X9R5_THEBA|nr:hypothetical protein [Thermococcus barophilus]ALM74475.1 hypothetical protein TBCH5v1_0507 [Thermococcus barophilus]